MSMQARIPLGSRMELTFLTPGPQHPQWKNTIGADTSVSFSVHASLVVVIEWLVETAVQQIVDLRDQLMGHRTRAKAQL